MNYSDLVFPIIIGVILLVIIIVQNRRLSTDMKEIKLRKIECYDLVMNSLKSEYKILNEKNDSQFEEQKKEMEDRLSAILDDKFGLSIEDALLILKRHDSGWFDLHFSFANPANDVIKNIVESKFQEDKSRSMDIINEIRSDL